MNFPSHFPTEEELFEFVTHSNKIEGESTDEAHPLFQSHLEIAKIIRAFSDLRSNIDELDKRPLRPCAIHEVLMEPEPHKTPGEYRTVDVYVGDKKMISPFFIESEMIDLRERILAGSQNQDIEEWAWSIHDEFEEIHPFIDGNGRTGRLMMNNLRLLNGLPWLTIYYEERFEYYARFH